MVTSAGAVPPLTVMIWRNSLARRTSAARWSAVSSKPWAAYMSRA